MFLSMRNSPALKTRLSIRIFPLPSSSSVAVFRLAILEVEVRISWTPVNAMHKYAGMQHFRENTQSFPKRYWGNCESHSEKKQAVGRSLLAVTFSRADLNLRWKLVRQAISMQPFPIGHTRRSSRVHRKSNADFVCARCSIPPRSVNW